MDDQPKQHGITFVAGEFFGVRLFAEVKVAGESVLKEMDDEISHQEQERRPGTGQCNALRQHLKERGAQHEARAQRDKITQVAALPVFLNNDGAAQAVGQGSGYSENNTCGDGPHRCNQSESQSSKPYNTGSVG